MQLAFLSQASAFGDGPPRGLGVRWAALFMKIDLSGTSIIQDYVGKANCCVCGETKTCNHHDPEMEYQGHVCRDCVIPLICADKMLNRVIPGFKRP